MNDLIKNVEDIVNAALVRRIVLSRRDSETMVHCDPCLPHRITIFTRRYDGYRRITRIRWYIHVVKGGFRFTAQPMQTGPGQLAYIFQNNASAAAPPSNIK